MPGYNSDFNKRWNSLMNLPIDKLQEMLETAKAANKGTNESRSEVDDPAFCVSSIHTSNSSSEANEELAKQKELSGKTDSNASSDVNSTEKKLSHQQDEISSLVEAIEMRINQLKIPVQYLKEKLPEADKVKVHALQAKLKFYQAEEKKLLAHKEALLAIKKKQEAPLLLLQAQQDVLKNRQAVQRAEIEVNQKKVVLENLIAHGALSIDIQKAKLEVTSAEQQLERLKNFAHRAELMEQGERSNALVAPMLSELAQNVAKEHDERADKIKKAALILMRFETLRLTTETIIKRLDKGSHSFFSFGMAKKARAIQEALDRLDSIKLHEEIIIDMDSVLNKSINGGQSLYDALNTQRLFVKRKESNSLKELLRENSRLEENEQSEMNFSL